MFGEGPNRIYNAITVLFLIFTVICIVLTILFAAGLMPVPFLAPRSMAIPQAAVLPTSTITNTPPPPTWTYTPTKTPTPSSTPTETSTVTPSLTITATAGPTDTPSITPTASDTPTATPSASFTPSMTPTGPTPTFTFTPSPFPFAVRGGASGVVFTANFANTAGCAWQGVAGQVFDLGNNPVHGYQIRVTGSGLGQGGAGVIVGTGSNTIYGNSGWEVAVSGQTSNNTYFVELLTPSGTVVSPAVQITFPNNCAQNLALVNFEQTRQYP